jgi:transmembrane sensor
MEESYTLAKWLNNELSDAELATFMASDEYEQYEKIRKYSAQLKVAQFDEDKVLKTILKSEKTVPKVMLLYKKWLPRIAAILVLGLGIAFALQNFVKQTQIAENGAKTNFSLPDDSQVVLNAGSQIDYKKWNWDNHRNLELQGEAYFKVAHGRKFQVTTPLGKVTVLGTRFNVKARKNRFDVTCFEGSVKVNYNTFELVLAHGQSVTFENGKQTNTNVNMHKPEWLKNKISFKKEQFQTVLDEIQRQYNVTINLKNPQKELFTGQIPTNNLEVTLQIITKTYGLNSKKIANNKLFLEEK